MLQASTVLLLCQLAGEALVQFPVMPIPGKVIGRALLLAAMSLRPGLAEGARARSKGVCDRHNLSRPGPPVQTIGMPSWRNQVALSQ